MGEREEAEEGEEVSKTLSDVMGSWSPTPTVVLRDGKLPPQHKTIYMIMLSYARPCQGRMAVWPGVATLSHQSGLSDRQVSRVIHDLVHKYKLIKRLRRKSGSSVTYFTDLDSVYSSDPTSNKIIVEHDMDGMTDMTSASCEADVVEADVKDTGSPENEPSAPSMGMSETDLGNLIMRLWNTRVASTGYSKRIALMSTGIGIRAARTFKALKDSNHSELTPEQVMDAIAHHMPDMFQTFTFEQIFLAKDNPVLARLLDGQYDRKERISDDKARLLDGAFE